jgi:dolichol-phosphate mannosyltransferase
MTETQPQGLDLLIFTATFNEAGNIREWHRRVRAVYPLAHLLVVDDSSPDGTAPIVEELQAGDLGLHLIVRPAKSGLGSAHRAAMVFALEHDYQVLVTMDADLSHQPEQLPLLVAKVPDYDFVIGTRHGEGSTDYTGFRLFLSRGGNLAARMFIPTGLTEYTNAMRAFSPRALEALFTGGIRDDGYAFFMECVDVLYRSGCRLTEVPVHFDDRTRGQSKIPKHQIWLSASTLARLSSGRLFHRRPKSARPLPSRMQG